MNLLDGYIYNKKSIFKHINAKNIISISHFKCKALQKKHKTKKKTNKKLKTKKQQQT
jgi:hypothetical protein